MKARKTAVSKTNAALKDFCSALKKHKSFFLSCHVTPEGDAIGSILAMQSLLKRLGKKTFVVCDDAFPERLHCLSDKDWHSMKELKRPYPQFEAMVIADCPTLERIGATKELLGPQTVIFNVDHHISNNRFGHHNYIRPEAAASGEVVMDIFKYFKMPLTKEEATNLYVALSTDTGSFKYSNTTVHSHRMAAELIATGIDVEKINEKLYATYSLNKINLYSRLLSRVKTTAGGQVAWAALRREDLKNSGATYEDTEGFIDFLRYIKEVKIAFFMSELENGHSIKVSFRSKANYDVNKIATYFKGGGHRKASGCTIPGTLEKAEAMILERLEKECDFS
ncbi:MAG: bifunctional oligoribonuclease/PAP phosphatase NrnA [Candidatus Omnitrophica bacterium]|nr:bifunctional oligoribonuclease/PAP phosphatase NrnA [Candidatus Omnitrophota bacterium]